MVERSLSQTIDGNFAETFPEGAVIESVKTGKSAFSPGNYGIVSVEGKTYSLPTTATNILLEAIQSGEVRLPAKIKLKPVKGKRNNYSVPVVVE